jgi:hypothetical protein
MEKKKKGITKKTCSSFSLLIFWWNVLTLGINKNGFKVKATEETIRFENIKKTKRFISLLHLWIQVNRPHGKHGPIAQVNLRIMLTCLLLAQDICKLLLFFGVKKKYERQIKLCWTTFYCWFIFAHMFLKRYCDQLSKDLLEVLII